MYNFPQPFLKDVNAKGKQFTTYPEHNFLLLKEQFSYNKGLLVLFLRIYFMFGRWAWTWCLSVFLHDYLTLNVYEALPHTVGFRVPDILQFNQTRNYFSCSPFAFRQFQKVKVENSILSHFKNRFLNPIFAKIVKFKDI